MVGSTGVFDRRLDEETLSGRLTGRLLKAIVHADYFAFAWLVFKAGTEIFRP